MLQTLYRKMIPVGIRYKLAKIRQKRTMDLTFQLWQERYTNGDYDKEYATELDYMINQGGHILLFPYEWTNAYKDYHVDVYEDKSGLSYVLHESKKLFFPKGYSKSFIVSYYLSLVVEQDARSPHYYFDKKEVDFQGKTFVDVGAAEGIISLNVIEDVDHVVLFECNKEWQKALEKTFEPWKEKTTIVPLFAGNENNKTTVKLDDWVKANAISDSLVLKLDVEGSEKSVLEGASNILDRQVLYAYVCTYHRPEDFSELSKYLGDHQFGLESSGGFMFYGTGPNAGFRKGLLRARK